MPGLRGLGAIAPTLEVRIDAFGSIRHQASASDIRWPAPIYLAGRKKYLGTVGRPST
jgi:hypothetical protein